MKRTARGLGVACVVATTIVVAAACGGGDPVITTTQCVPRESKACTGLGPCKGQQVCGNDGQFGACVCGDASIEDAGPPDVGADADAKADVVADQGVDAPIDVGIDAPPFEAGVFDGGPTHWARAFAPEGTSNGVVVDANQNIIVGGAGSGLGEGVVKLNAKGATQWHKTISWVQQVAVDATGAVYAAGFKDGSPIDFGNGAVTAAGGFLVKYDVNGVYQWLYGPLPNTQFNDVAVKSNGNAVVVGQFGGTVDFGNGDVSTPLGVLQATLVEHTPNGTFVRERHYGVDGGALFKSVAIDASDDIFLAGSFQGTSISFGGPTMLPPSPGNSQDVFVVKLNASAGYVAQADGKLYGDYLNDMALDAAGRPYLTGVLGSQIQFGSSPVVAFGAAPNVFVALLDQSLNEVWSRRFGQGGIANGIAVDPGGGAVITGWTSGSLYFGLPGMPTVQGSYIARFDANGTVVSNQGFTVANGGGVTGWGLAHVTGSDFVWVGNCGGGLLSLPSGPLACSFSNSGNGFAVRLAE